MSARPKPAQTNKSGTNSLRAATALRRKRLLASLAVLGALGGGGALGVVWLLTPVAHEHKTTRVVIPSGSSAARVGEILRQGGLIHSAPFFSLYLRAKGEGDRFKAGRYALSPDMTLAQIIRALQSGPLSSLEDKIRVTIPEGYTLRQIADALNEKGVTDGAAFVKAATDPNAIAALHADFALPADTLEGYLFPDTYYFPAHTPPARIIEAMLLNFYTRFARPYQSEIADSGRDLHRITTEASLVEREARVPEDRARIASVLENRLRRGMRLEVDATVLYALGHHKEQVLYRDLNVRSPYNTYRRKGLPPGPNANPGLAAHRAAQRPERSDYLYYVARPDGAHIFTRTLAEHEQARRQARMERRRQGASSEEARPNG